jgi:hypothetical protein
MQPWRRAGARRCADAECGGSVGQLAWRPWERVGPGKAGGGGGGPGPLWDGAETRARNGENGRGRKVRVARVQRGWWWWLWLRGAGDGGGAGSGGGWARCVGRKRRCWQRRGGRDRNTAARQAAAGGQEQQGSRAAGQGKRETRAATTRASTTTSACKRAGGVQACRRAGGQACKRAGGQAGRAGKQGRDCEAARLRRTSGGEASRVGERLAICSSMMWLIEHPRKTAAPPRRLTADQQQDAVEKQAHGPHGPHGSFEAAPGGLQSRSRLGAYSHAQHTARRTAHSTQHIAYPAHSTHRYGTEPKRVQLRVKQDARCGFALPSKLQRRRELHWART